MGWRVTQGGRSKERAVGEELGGRSDHTFVPLFGPAEKTQTQGPSETFRWQAP